MGEVKSDEEKMRNLTATKISKNRHFEIALYTFTIFCKYLLLI